MEFTTNKVNGQIFVNSHIKIFSENIYRSMSREIFESKKKI